MREGNWVLGVKVLVVSETELRLYSIFYCVCPDSRRGGRRGKLCTDELENFISLPLPQLQLHPHTRFCRILPHFSLFAPLPAYLSSSLSRCCMHFCIVSQSVSAQSASSSIRACLSLQFLSAFVSRDVSRGARAYYRRRLAAQPQSQSLHNQALKQCC